MEYRIVTTDYFGMPCYEVYRGSVFCCQFRTKAQAVKYVNSQEDEQ